MIGFSTVNSYLKRVKIKTASCQTATNSLGNNITRTV